MMKNFERSVRLMRAAVKNISFILIVCPALSLIGPRLNATPITWYLESATLINGGQLTGSFVYDATTSTISSVNLASTPDGTVLPAEAWTSATLYPGTGYALPTAVQVVNDNLYGLLLAFSAPLSDSGGTVNLPLGGSLIQALTGPTAYDFIQAGEVTTQVATLIGFQGGTSSDPVLLPGGQPVAGVVGTIGGDGSQEYYTFLWTGGAFSATASITGAPNSSASYLFSEGITGSCGSGGSATLNSGDSFTGTISNSNLPAGQYCIGLDANSASDPAFALTFNAPVEGTAPEPSTLVLMLGGLGMAAVLRLTKR